MMIACEFNEFDAVKLLLEKHADPDIHNKVINFSNFFYVCIVIVLEGGEFGLANML